MAGTYRRACVVGLLALVGGAVVAAGQTSDARRSRKFIATGWDNANTERLRANLDQMEPWPFDGATIAIEGRTDQAKTCRMFLTHSAEPWQRPWFASCVDDLKACRPKRLTDNFALVGANPGGVDFFDDAGWRTIVEHWRIAAWLAKAGGLKGLVFDPEPYTPPHAQFSYAAQPQHDQHTFADYAAKARQRGREVMQAVAAEYGDITLLCYFMNSVAAGATGRADPEAVLATMVYGLYPAFIDGWLDAAPATASFVDGCETAYRFNSELEYLQAAIQIKGACQELVSPANRAKYRAQVQVGFGLYLDAYWNPKDSKWGAWYVDGKGIPRVDRLRINAAAALAAADEYVWVYGEKFRWWPTPNGSVRPQTWPEALPGCDEALGYARDPEAYARQAIARLQKAGQAVNLARNGDFTADKARSYDGREVQWADGRPPAGWHAWQDDKSKGAFTWDRQTGSAGAGSARAAGVVNGCFLQSHPAAAGERYAVRCVRRLAGKGEAWVRVRWQTAAGEWTAEASDRICHCRAARDAWGEIFGVVEVPASAGRLVILLGVGGQATGDDVAWFDDVALFKLAAQRRSAAEKLTMAKGKWTVGPGEADFRGADNKAIQAAVDAAAAAGGGQVVLLPGVYVMHDSLHLRSGVHVRGSGRDTVLRKAPEVRSGLSADLGYGHFDVSIAEADKFAVGMGVLVGDDRAGGFYQTQGTLTWRKGDRFGISRMLNHDYSRQANGFVVSSFPILSAQDVRDASAADLAIDGNRQANPHVLGGCRGGGVFLLQARDVTLRGLHVANVSGDGISFQQSHNTLIEDCTCEDNAGHGLHPGSGSVAPVLRNCTSRRNGVDGIFYCLRVSYSLCEGCTLADNARDGVSIGGRDTDHLIRANRVHGNGRSGVFFRPHDEVMAGHRNRVESNEIADNCRKEGQAEVDLAGRVRDVHVLANRIRPVRAGVAGIRVAKGTEGVVLHGNHVDADEARAIVIEGDRSAVSLAAPASPLAVGPDAAPPDAAAHLSGAD